MSTYLNMSNPQTRKNDFSDCPEILKQYLYYLENIRALSARSVNGYAIDLRTFFRFMKWHRGMVDSDADFSKSSITDIDDVFIKAITKSDIYEYLHYVTNILYLYFSSATLRFSLIFSLKCSGAITST